MTEELINKLREITPEEQKILEGHRSIEKELYMDAESDVVDARKLLDEGKLIQVRAHTRFAHFPAHRHNYVEMIYMWGFHINLIYIDAFSFNKALFSISTLS